MPEPQTATVVCPHCHESHPVLVVMPAVQIDGREIAAANATYLAANSVFA